MITCSIKYISYENSPALQNIDFKLASGECLVVTGGNGSGKSTLLLYIAGLLSEKLVTIDATLNIPSNKKLVFIAQNPDSNVISSDVKSELMLFASGDVDKINTLISHYNLTSNFLGKKTTELSGGQKQLLTILCGALQDVDVYIFDEPTAMLDSQNTQMVIQMIEQLLSENKTILLSTHDANLFQLKHKFIKLKSKTQTNKPEIFFTDNIVTPPQYKDNRFTIKDMTFFYKKEEPLFHQFNLSLINGDILLISGKNGSGKTTLAKLMAGLIKPKEGKVNLDSEQVKDKDNYLPSTFSYSMQNPNWQLLFDTVEGELSYSIDNYYRGSDKQQRKLTLLSICNYFGIKQKKQPRELSFGQRKFITNFSYYHDPLVHFFDEPDLGIDDHLNTAFIDYLQYRKNKGLISVIVSHNNDKYLSISTKEIDLNE